MKRLIFFLAFFMVLFFISSVTASCDYIIDHDNYDMMNDSKTYCLNSNLTVGNGYGINIGCSYCTLDCQGYAVIGNNTGDYGGYMISDAGEPYGYPLTNHDIIQNCVVVGKANYLTWGLAIWGHHQTVKNNFATHTIWGLENGGLFNMFENNVVVDVWEIGLYTFEGDNTVFRNNVVIGANTGIWADSSYGSHNIFENIYLYNVSLYGIGFGYLNNGTFKNIIIDNRGIPRPDWRGYDENIGIYSEGGSRNDVFDNISMMGEKIGLYFGSTDEQGLVFRNSIIAGNDYAFIADNWYNTYPYPFSEPTTGNRFYNNVFNGSISFIDENNPDKVFNFTNYWNTTRQSGNRIFYLTTQATAPRGGSCIYPTPLSTPLSFEIGGNYYTNRTGNGYSDTCADSNDDGFCDSPYILMPNNVDNLPLSRKSYEVGGYRYVPPCDYTQIQTHPDIWVNTIYGFMRGGCLLFNLMLCNWMLSLIVVFFLILLTVYVLVRRIFS